MERFPHFVEDDCAQGEAMNIVVFSSYFLPHKGGVENYVYQTSKRLVKKGHKVWVVTALLKGAKKDELIDGIRVLRVPAFEPLRDKLTVPLVLKDLDKIGRIDVIITHTRFYPLSLAGGVISRWKGIPWLHIEHGTSQVSYSNPVANIGARVVDATAGKWILCNARVAGVSKASCAFVKKFGARSCEVIYNGVDTKFFDDDKKKHKGVKVVFVGRLIEEKGVRDLVAAVKGLNVELSIVGSGPLLGKLPHCVGEKSQKEIREILSKSDILVNPSYGEGLPTSVLEAGAMGLAVIATDVGGTSEIIDNGKNGFLVHPGNIAELREKIKLLSDASLRDKFGRALQKKVREKFDWNKIAGKLDKVLKSL